MKIYLKKGGKILVIIVLLLAGLLLGLIFREWYDRSLTTDLFASILIEGLAHASLYAIFIGIAIIGIFPNFLL